MDDTADAAGGVVVIFGGRSEIGVELATRLAQGATVVLAARGADRLDEQVAAVFVEPVAANMGVVAPNPGFLDGLRAECDRVGALLVFDEVITGFRLGTGGAQEQFDVRPDLTTFGKVIGGGLPIGAVGGRRDIMETLSPLGKVFHAGTTKSNGAIVTNGGRVLAVTATAATQEQARKDAYTALQQIRFDGMYARKDIGA
jgi:glutamate-1-semialdehyde aminotransferase